MKLLSTLAATAASLAFAMPAAAVSTLFAAHLDGASESPPNASPAFGEALVTLDDTVFTVAVHVTFSDLSAPASAAHIHCCTAVPSTGNIGVFVGLAGFPSATSGTYDNTFVLPSASFSSLLTGIQEDRSYVNIHSSTFPGGEIRGFLQPVPEPETWALMLGGLGLVGAAMRRKPITA